MFIIYTKEELAQYNFYTEALRNASDKFKEQMQEAGDEEKAKLVKDIFIDIDIYKSQLAEFENECYTKRIKELEAGGTDALIKSTKEQITLIIDNIYNYYKENPDIFTSGALTELKVAKQKGNKLYLKFDFAYNVCIEELKKHFELADDKTKEELKKIIIEGLQNNPLIIDSAKEQKPEAPELEAKRREALKQIKRYGMMNDGSARKLYTETDPDGLIIDYKLNGQLQIKQIIKQGEKNKEAVNLYISLIYEGKGAQLSKPINAFDIAVYNAVSTLFFNWQQENKETPLYITPAEIWRTMNGQQYEQRKKVNAPQLQKICDSMDKMRFTKFYMDLSEEIEKHQLKINDSRIVKGKIETYFLQANKIEFTNEKNITLTGYHIEKEPMLYTYNRVKGHLLLIKYEMLDTSKALSVSENVIEFKSYLLAQIQLMINAAEEEAEKGSRRNGSEQKEAEGSSTKNGGRFQRSRTILLDSIYKNTGILTPEQRAEKKTYKTLEAKQKDIRKMRKADREKIESLLNVWKEKGHIKDYAPEMENKQTIKGYKIELEFAGSCGALIQR